MAPPFRPLTGLSGGEVASPSGGRGNREGFVLRLLCVGLSGRPAFGCPSDRGPVAVSHVKVAILAGQRTILRTAVFIPTALLAAGNPEAGRLVASNFLVKASVMKMAEKQNNESFGIDLNNCRPPTTPSTKVSKGPFALFTLQLQPFLLSRKEAFHKADLGLADFSCL